MRATNAGKVNGQGENLIMFSFWKRNGEYGSSMCVEESKAGESRQALVDIGWKHKSQMPLFVEKH